MQPTKARATGSTRMIAIAAGLIVALISIFGVSSAVQAYTTTGCKWGSANISYFANTSVAAYKSAYDGAASVWTTTDVNMNASASSNWTSVAGYYGATGYDGYTAWGCSLFGVTHTVSMELNRSYIEGYPALKKRAVALHEFGHGLGLNHSTVGGYPIMNPCPACAFTNGTTTLTTDDRNGANALY